jgi:hypothetical protein
MSFISLRKHAPEPEPDEDLDATAEEDPDGEPEKPAKEPPTTWTGALLAGVTGPGRWLMARFGPTTSWIAHVVAVWACGFYGGWAAFGVIAGFLLAVLLFIPREFLERLAAAIEQLGELRHQPGVEDAPEAGEWPPSNPLVTVLWRLIGDAPGVHLKTLAEHLQAAAPDQPVDRAQVRAKLAALQIPIRGSVRDAAGRVNEGVYGADLRAWQEALPQSGAGTPSEGRSDPVAAALTCDVGDDATDVAMPFSRLFGLWLRGGA